jgi:hypothetical protein
VQIAVISAFLRHTAFVILVEYPASSNLVIISSRSMDFGVPRPSRPGELEMRVSSSVAVRYGDDGAFGAFDDLGLIALFFTNIDSFGC